MNIIIIKDLGHGFYIIRKHAGYSATQESFLVRMKTDGINVSDYEEFLASKFEKRLLKEFQIQLKSNKKIIMNVEDTIQNLTIPQLKSLLPSYYQYVIERRIKELETEDAVTKVKRSRKATTTTTGRKRVVRKKSV